jgi:hypothetical protein
MFAVRSSPCLPGPWRLIQSRRGIEASHEGAALCNGESTIPYGIGRDISYSTTAGSFG